MRSAFRAVGPAPFLLLSMVVLALVLALVLAGRRDRDAADRLGDLPVIELPATAGNDGQIGKTLAILLSGDGGWADLDKVFGEAFQQRGLSTVGFDCLAYFYQVRQPDPAALDIARILRCYLKKWRKDRIVFVGFSFGACWLPILVNRLPADLRERIDWCVMLGPSSFVNVEIHYMDWVSDVRRPGALEVQPEAGRLTPPVLCVHGEEEEDSICPWLQGRPRTRILKMPGDHHYDYNYQPVIDAIFAALAEHPAAL